MLNYCLKRKEINARPEMKTLEKQNSQAKTNDKKYRFFIINLNPKNNINTLPHLQSYTS